MLRPALALLLVAFASSARAQEEAPEWPDPGSEEPGGPKIFPPDLDAQREAPAADLTPAENVLQPTYRWSWYGWRSLIGDGSAVVLGLAALVTAVAEQDGAPETAIAGLVAYATGGPIAHFTMGNWGRALISFGMRIAGPTVMSLAFFGACGLGDCDGDLTVGMVGLGGFVGAFLAAGLDTALVARHRVEVQPQIAVAPVISAVPRGPKTVGLAVQF